MNPTRIRDRIQAGILQNPVFAPTYAGPPEQAPSADVQPARPQYVFPRPYEIPYGDL